MTSALQTEHDFHALKGGDQVALVCKMSDSVQVIDVKDEAQAKEMCKEGTMVHCPDCKKEYKVTYGGNPSRSTGAPTKKLVMVNDKGEPCMFYAKLK